MGVRYPADYASAFQKVVFELSGFSPDADDCVAVDIMEGYNNEASGVKYYYGHNLIEVDVSAYARAALKVEPVLWCGLYLASVRSVPMSVRVGGYQSEKVLVCAATQPLPLNTLLSSLSKRTIALDERDEIAFVSDEHEIVSDITIIDRKGTEYYFGGMLFLYDKGVAVYGLDVAEVAIEAQERGIAPEDIAQIIVGVKLGAEKQIRVTYDVRSNTNGVRLAWVNHFGAIDYYTFPNIIASHLVALPEDIVGEPRRSYTECEISSEIVPQEIAEALADIVTSSKVWVVKGDTYTPCEIVTDAVEWCNCSAPTAVKLVIRTQNTPQSNG